MPECVFVCEHLLQIKPTGVKNDAREGLQDPNHVVQKGAERAHTYSPGSWDLRINFFTVLLSLNEIFVVN